MLTDYGTAVICAENNRFCDLDGTDTVSFNPYVQEFMMDYNKTNAQLEYVWTQWHNQCGAQIKGNYSNYLQLMNRIGTRNSRH